MEFIDSIRNEKIQILPIHRMRDNILRVRQVEAKFWATYYVARMAKQLLTSEGIIKSNAGKSAETDSKYESPNLIKVTIFEQVCVNH